MFGKALQKNPAFIELRRIEAAKEIATVLGRSRNKMFLEADSLLLNITSPLNENLEKAPRINAPKTSHLS